MITGTRLGIVDVAGGDSSLVVMATLNSSVSGEGVGVDLPGCLTEDGIPVVLD